MMVTFILLAAGRGHGQHGETAGRTEGESPCAGAVQTDGACQEAWAQVVSLKVDQGRWQ